MSGDFDGDARLSPSIARQRYLVSSSSSNYPSYITAMGRRHRHSRALTSICTADKPAIFRPSTGTWWILKSSTNYTIYVSQQWGVSSDIPGGSPTTPTPPAPATPTVTAMAVSGTAPAVGLTAQYTATATLSNGTTQNVTAQATWQSSTRPVATVLATGVGTLLASIARCERLQGGRGCQQGTFRHRVEVVYYYVWGGQSTIVLGFFTLFLSGLCRRIHQQSIRPIWQRVFTDEHPQSVFAIWVPVQ